MRLKYTPALFVCASLLVGCATPGAVDPDSAAQEVRPSAGCGPTITGSDALAVGEWRQISWSFVDWVGDEDRPERAFYQVIEGPCAKDVTGATSAANRIRIASGAIFNFSDPDRPRPNPQAEDLFKSDPIGALPPPMRGATFVRAARVAGANLGDGGQRDYVGLWSDRRGYVIAKFSVIDGLGAGPAHPLVRSRDPIRGIAYFPAPDVPAGSVGFVQFGSDGVVRALGFGWDHPDSFPCLTPEQLVTRVPGGVPGRRRSDRRCG